MRLKNKKGLERAMRKSIKEFKQGLDSGHKFVVLERVYVPRYGSTSEFQKMANEYEQELIRRAY